MIAGTIIRQFKLICIDPYANAFNNGPTGEGSVDDKTGSRPNKNVYERKWEIDSHCYPIRLAYAYWKTNGDTSVFGEEWLDAIELTLEVFKEQQRKKEHGDYIFLRKTDRQLDTKCCVGRGNPVKPCGLIASSFRPSDDATTFEFLIPANFFAVKSLRQAAEILGTVNGQNRLAGECTSLANEVEKLSALALSRGKDTVTPEDVNEVASSTPECDTFALSNAILDRSRQKAYFALEDMKLRRVDPTIVMGMIARTLDDLTAVAHLLDEGRGVNDIRDILGMNEYKLKIYMTAAKRYGAQRLSEMLSSLAETDAGSKYGGVTGYTAIELFLSKNL
jgi:hypothetical protein